MHIKVTFTISAAFQIFIITMYMLLLLGIIKLKTLYVITHYYALYHRSLTTSRGVSQIGNVM